MTESDIDTQEMRDLILAPFQELLKALASPAMRPVLEDLGRLHVQLVEVQKKVNETAIVVARELSPVVEGLVRLQPQIDAVQATVNATAAIVARELEPVAGGLARLEPQLDALHKELEKVAKAVDEVAAKIPSTLETLFWGAVSGMLGNFIQYRAPLKTICKLSFDSDILPS